MQIFASFAQIEYLVKLETKFIELHNELYLVKAGKNL